MYLTVLSFQTSFSVKTTVTDDATHEYTLQTFFGHVGDALVGNIERSVRESCRKKFWYSTVLLLRTTKIVKSQPPVKIKKLSLAHFSLRAMGFPHAFTS